jgi:CheY-like chemotaxis protein
MSDLRTDPESILHSVSAPLTSVRTLHILIADGNATSREIREAQLRSAGFRVSVARTGFEAIVKASCHLPDLILVDASLGDSDVHETMQLLAMCPATAQIPVVRLTPGRRIPARLLAGVTPR